MSFGKGGIGGILGGILGSILAPEIGIPALAASAGGSFLGSTAQGFASGEKPGQALLGGLEAGGTSALLGGLGDFVTGTPLSSTSGPFGNLLGGGGGDAAGGTFSSAGEGLAGAAGGIGADAGLGALASGGIGDAAGAAGSATGGLTGVSGALTAGADAAGTGAALTSSPLATPGPGAGAGFGAGDPTALSANVAGSSQIPEIGTSLGVSGPASENYVGFSETSPTSDAASSGLNAQELSQLSGGGSGTSLIPSNGPFFNSGTDNLLTSGGNNNFFIPGTDNTVPGTASGTVDTSGGGFGSSIVDYLKNNPGLLLGGGLLGTSLLKGNQQYPAEKSLNTNAAGLNTTAAGLTTAGNQNLQALTTGRLPPGAQSALDSATASSKAAVKSNAARLGLTGSTMEASALADVDQKVEAQKVGIINDLVHTGLSEVNAGTADTNAANAIYSNLLNTQIGQDKATQDALARFAAALAGNSGQRTSA